MFLKQVGRIVGEQIIRDGHGEMPLVCPTVFAAVEGSVRLLEDLDIVGNEAIVVQKPSDQGRKVLESAGRRNGKRVRHEALRFLLAALVGLVCLSRRAPLFQNRVLRGGSVRRTCTKLCRGLWVRSLGQGDDHVFISIVKLSQDINVLAYLRPLKASVEFRHSLRSKNHVAVGAEGAFRRQRLFAGRTGGGISVAFPQPTTQGLPEVHHVLSGSGFLCPSHRLPDSRCSEERRYTQRPWFVKSPRTLSRNKIQIDEVVASAGAPGWLPALLHAAVKLSVLEGPDDSLTGLPPLHEGTRGLHKEPMSRQAG